MLRKTSTLAVLALMTSATFAAAEEHVVLFLGDAFFPEVSYVDPGDTVRFVNASTQALNIVSEGSEWSVGPIAVETDASINITGNMTLKFFDADSAGDDGVLTVNGNLSYDDAPQG